MSEGLVHGADSPCNVALRRNVGSRIACICYTLFVLGIWMLSGANNLSRAGGITICVSSAALFFYVRWSIKNFFLEVCAIALKADLADITAAYKLSPPIYRAQFPPKPDPNGFWVAVSETSGQHCSQVIGFLGLEYPVGGDPSSAELRRMFISMHHRRRGIASQLIRTALSHAQQFNPPLRTLVLETSEFQLAAQRLYEKHGFVFAERRVMRMGLLSSVSLLRFRRNTGNTPSEVIKGIAFNPQILIQLHDADRIVFIPLAKSNHDF
ncbi:acyl-CoA N-acyltransferase [Mycena albidolilacea]|uniref:Acyl-CoA N-acyltransferase n=1 Tax=Mycena albidolilacea TaxID=1033008 RepID=A0AAD6ZM20_9AGAR|nr:acyl-CoA N-acyltransferase [Mycena albidolilacea]